jgi:hypothetical protein
LAFVLALFLTVCTINGIVSAYDYVTYTVVEYFVFHLSDGDRNLTAILGFILFIGYVAALIAVFGCVVCKMTGWTPCFDRNADDAYTECMRLEEKTRAKPLLCKYDSDTSDDNAYKEMP